MKLALSLAIAMSLGQFKEICTVELRHLSFGGTSGVITRNLFATLNGGSNVPEPVYFPFYDNFTTSAFIGVNGVISFGGEVHNSPQAFGNLFSSEGTSYVIAPFWSNNDIRRDGRVRYEVYDGSTTASIDVLNRISNLIASGSGEAFQGTWMLLVEWENCHPYPHGQSSQPVDSYLQQANEYQAMAITDGVQHSYAIFIYECGDIQWGADMANGSIFARVGISVGGNILYSHSLSGTNVVDTIDCLNLPTSPWVNLIYDISLITPSNTSYESRPHTMSTISSSILNESSKPIASSRSEELFFTASAQRLMTLRLTESALKTFQEKTSPIMRSIISVSTLIPSSSNHPQYTGSDDHVHSETTKPELTTPQSATPTETIVAVALVLSIATGLVVCFTVLMLLAKHHKKRMRIVAQNTNEVKHDCITSEVSQQSHSLVAIKIKHY